jgi:hypothetical protein
MFADTEDYLQAKRLRPPLDARGSGYFFPS